MVEARSPLPFTLDARLATTFGLTEGMIPSPGLAEFGSSEVMDGVHARLGADPVPSWRAPGRARVVAHVQRDGWCSRMARFAV